MQLELIDTAHRGQHGATWQAGNWQCRNWNGWFQHREGGQGPWQFAIPWFSNDDVTCTVYGLSERGDMVQRDGVPIDGHNRILIEGRRYGRDRWTH